MIWSGFIWPRNRVQWCYLKNKLVNNWVPQKAGSFLTSCVTIPSESERIEREWHSFCVLRKSRVRFKTRNDFMGFLSPPMEIRS